MEGGTYHLLGELRSLILTSVMFRLKNIMHHKITAPVQNTRHQTYSQTLVQVVPARSQRPSCQASWLAFI